MLSHVVIFWTKAGAPEAADRLIAGIEKYLRPIPQILSLHVGKPVMSDRPVVDTTYQVGLLVQTKDKADEIAYQKHDLHTQFIEQVFSQVCDRVRVYDFAD